MQNSAVHKVFDFVRGVDAAQSVEIERRAILARNHHGYRLARLKHSYAGDCKAVIGSQAKRCPAFAF